jgi:hypothetical protein
VPVSANGLARFQRRPGLPRHIAYYLCAFAVPAGNPVRLQDVWSSRGGLPPRVFAAVTHLGSSLAEDGMQEYFVYESWTRDGVRVHESGCPECVDGAGLPSDFRRGKWHGPYRDRSWAMKFAATLRHSDTKPCDQCMH